MKINIEFSELSAILDNVKEKAKNYYKTDGEIKKVIDNIFFEIDKLLLSHEEEYKFKELQEDVK
jgi:hypothetical protein